MKAAITFLSVLLLASLSLSSIAQKRTINVNSFSELTFGLAGNIYIKQGNTQSVEVDCSDEVFEKLDFNHSGDRLTIQSEGSWGWNSGIKKSELTVYITMVKVNRLSLGGSGSLMGDGIINSEDLGLYVSGSGNMDLNIQTVELTTRVSGSGKISLAGNADELDAKISGSGSVKARDVIAKNVTAAISGSGSVYIEATDEIKARISGSGSVYYSGDPKRLDSNSSGSGKIRKL